MNLHDVIQINPEQTSAAIILEQGISNNALVAHYTPTQAAIQVFKHLAEAVLPSAKFEQRALNLYGSYGSGKSHLAVVLAQLLRDGASTKGFSKLIERLCLAGENQLADKLKEAFLPKTDKEAKPYLLVSLYASGTTSLGAKLMEGLFDALQRESELDIKAILPSTEYEVCVKRFEKMIDDNEAFSDADLSQWTLKRSHHYISTEDLLFNLKGHQPLALEVFLDWHEAVCFGQAFDISQAGGKNYIDAYLEAGKNLAEKYNYGGIVVLWDEFGNALEDLIGNTARNAGQEIMSLQQFIETVCEPDTGHTLFFGVTHVSFQEYGDRTHASEVIKESLEKISGRFNKAFKIELNAAESDGYHLLGMQKTWSEQGKQLLSQDQPAKLKLLEACKSLPLFQSLNEHLEQVFEDVYPLHPVMAVGLFNLSKLAQANRTALTFFRDNAGEILNAELNDHHLWQKELVRLPQLLHYYADNLKKESPSDWRRYEQAISNVNGDSAEEIKIRKDILSVLLLAQLLENVKASDELLACVLYDDEPNTAHSEALNQHSAYLKDAGLIWKNPVTHFWLFAGESGVDSESLIEKEIDSFSEHSYQYLLETYPDMQEDILPILGEHDLEPSACGIIRSYAVNLLTPSLLSEQLKTKGLSLSAQVFLVLADTQQEANTLKTQIQEMPSANHFFWIPVLGIQSETTIENDISFKFNDLLCRYLAINVQLKSSASSENVKKQLEAKWESNRQAIKQLLQKFYGRSGLNSAKCQIYQAGSSELLSCESWHGFKELLAVDVAATYPQEITIRAMNMNGLRNEKYTGYKKIINIVERILKFDENPSYQKDLLGFTDTSEEGSLIDGVLGANQLFIERSGGWDIKLITETEGHLKTVLKLLHDSLLRKNRKDAYVVSELRKKLMAAPYGIPACTLPIFTAIAIRQEVKRLRWVGSDNSFSKNLTLAFKEGSKLKIRLSEFGGKQFAMLFLMGKSLGIEKDEALTNEEYATVCAAKLRKFVNTKPEGVKASNQLDFKTQKLVAFLNTVGKSAQELADFLIDILDVKKDLPSHDVSKVIAAVQALFNDFLKVEDAKLHEIKLCWDDAFPVNKDEKQTIVTRLKQIGTGQAQQLADLLVETNDAEDIEPKTVIEKMLSRSFDECSDSDIGRCTGAIEQLIEQAVLTPEPIAPPITPLPIIPPPIITPNPELEGIVNEIRYIFSASKLPKEKIINVLNQVLQHYRD